MKQLNYHKGLDTISILRFNKLRDSILKGAPEFGNLLYLEKNEPVPELNEKQKEFLQGVYLDLLNQIPEVSTELLSSYRAYYESYIKTRIEINKAKISGLRGEEIKLTFANHNKYFTDYINVLNRDNTDFTITEYYIKNEIKEIFSEMFQNTAYPAEFELIKNTIQAFHTIDRYKYEVERLKVNEYFKKVFLSETFLEHFVSSKIITIDDLTLYTDRLSEDFKLVNNYEGFIEFRHKVLSLDNIGFKPLMDYDFYEEVSAIKQILGFDFDISTTSVLEYYSHLKSAQVRVSRETKKDKAV